MSWFAFQKGLYEYYCKHEENPMSRDEFDNAVKKYKDRKDKYIVYYGYSRKDKAHEKVIYVGTTIQHPISRWYYHSIHGKDLDFVEAFRYDNENDMLDKEYEMIQKLKPSCNKIIKRRQNYNVVLTREELEARKGDPSWCQCCFRRHVNKGYKFCYYCS